MEHDGCDASGTELPCPLVHQLPPVVQLLPGTSAGDAQPVVVNVLEVRQAQAYIITDMQDRFAETFGPPRAQGTALSDRERDIAASLQLRLEEVAFHVLNRLHQQTGLNDLGLAGGVAYNSVMNGKILLKTPFRRVFVQPAAGDSGTTVGVC